MKKEISTKKSVTKKRKIENNNEELTNKELTNKELTNELNNSEQTFDNKLSKCLEKCNLFETEINNSIVLKDNQHIKKHFFSSEKEYQNSFDDIISFSKDFTTREKNAIDVVMFHTANEDGLMGAYYTYKYFESQNNKDISYIPTKPSSSNNMVNYRIKKHDSLLRNKNLIIIDLSFGKANYSYLSEICKSIIIIDDHPRKNNILSKYKNIKAFIGDDKHCASVYTYKFFNPKHDVPLDLIYIDNNDRKLQLPFINASLYRYLTVYNNFKIIHSPYLNIHFTKNSDFKKLEELLKVSIDYKCLVGKLYDEVCNNIKTQVAQNAVKRTFCGYPVYILNYNDPVLYKMVSREMFSNAERKGDHIYFAVLYGYEFLSNGYKIFVSEKHTGREPTHTKELYEILNKYGKSHPKGGKVTQYVLNFYYPHDKNHDIWDMIQEGNPHGYTRPSNPPFL